MINPNLSTVIPMSAGIEPRYEGQSTSAAQLDTRMRGYDEVMGMPIKAVVREYDAMMTASNLTVVPAQAGTQES